MSILDPAWRELTRTSLCRLGIELTKIMVLQYSNQETSVTIGESVRDEDGMSLVLILLSTIYLYAAVHLDGCAYYVSAAIQSSFSNPHDPTISTMA